MKKFIFLFCLVLLAGCSSDVSVYSTYEQQEKVVKEEVLSPEVTIYGVNDSSKGYVIDVEKHKKWIVTMANSVAGHANVLVETSMGQIVKGEIVAVDEVNNIAIIFTKLTSDITPLNLSKENIEENLSPQNALSEAIINKDGELLGIVTVVRKDEEFQKLLLDSGRIQTLLTKAKENPIHFKDRLSSSSYFKDFPKVNYNPSNIINEYDKPTFTYNPDELYAFITDFQKALNQYFEEGDLTILKTYIASDDLLHTIQQIAESDSGLKQFGEIDFTSSVVNDFQYVVEGKTTLLVDEEVGELKGTYKCILMDGEWKLVSAYYE